jgi:endonuclease III
MRAGYAWDLAQQRTEIDLRDPDDLWGRITRKPLRSWNADWNDPNQRWHRFPKGHERVWRIGKRLLEEYDGDARNIWKGQSPTETLDRLLRLGVGEQISRMVVGALIDSKAIRGVGDVKADVHVRRVLGRVLTGRKFSEAEATAATRQMHSRNPWKLDAPLYFVGKDYCFESRPDCQKCDLAGECTFRARSSRVARRR